MWWLRPYRRRVGPTPCPLAVRERSAYSLRSPAGFPHRPAGFVCQARNLHFHCNVRRNMDRKTEAKARYDRLKNTLADDGKVRRKTSRARVIGLLVVGAWVIVPAAFWRVDMDEFLRPEFFRDPTPHEAHFLSLPRGEAEGAAGAREWEAAAYHSIDYPLLVGSAYRESGLFPSDASYALGLKVQVPEGQRIHLRMEGEGGEEWPVFLDLYRAAPDSLVDPEAERLPRPALVSGERVENGSWTFDSPDTAWYVVRLQPEFKEAGRYQVTVGVGAPWHFPVAGAGVDDIGGVFGDSRDGGQRDHHGVDIFKPRGTPVLAASDGLVRSVDTTNIGGRVVWQREAGGNHSIYYAHLHEILVREGQQLRAGDTVGLVGNTGNARTTPTHLHFGAYRRGPVDPWDLIFPRIPEAPEVSVDLDGLGEEGSVGEGVRLRRSPSTRGPVFTELSAAEHFRILGGAGEWYRVALPEGEQGFVSARLVTLATNGGTPPSNP